MSVSPEFEQKLDMLVAEEIAKTEHGRNYPMKVGLALVRRSAKIYEDFADQSDGDVRMESFTQVNKAESRVERALDRLWKK